MSDGRTSNVIKNTAAGLTLRAVSVLSQFVLRTVFLRVLGNEYAGLSGVCSDILNILLVETAMLYALYRPLAEGDTARGASLMRFFGRAFRWTGVAVLLAGGLCAPFLGHLIKDVPAVREDIRRVFLLYAGDAALSCFFASRAVLLKAEQRGRVVSLYGIGAQLLECALSVALLLTLKSFTAWLLLHIAVNAAKNALLWRGAGKRCAPYLAADAPLPDGAETKRLVKDLLCLSAYDLSGVAVNSTDSIFIAAFLGAPAVAVVGNFTLIINTVKNGVLQAVNAVKPGVGDLAAGASREKQHEVFRQMDFACWTPSSGSCGWATPTGCRPPPWRCWRRISISP